jgi:hypothetical protein
LRLADDSEWVTVDSAPLTGADWLVTKPEKQGLDPNLVSTQYMDAGKLEMTSVTTPDPD